MNSLISKLLGTAVGVKIGNNTILFRKVIIL